MKLCFLALIASGFIATSAFTNCLTDKGPYQDGSGFANFPFYNSCDQNVMVSLCVKTYTGGETMYTPYIMAVNRLSTGTITAGKWNTFDSYRWQEDQKVACPFF